MIKIALLGSTGSIGRQVLNVVRAHKNEFEIVSLSAGENAELLQSQIAEFKPKVATLTNPEKISLIKELPVGVSLYTGENSVFHAITDDCDLVFVAISGFDGFLPTLYAIEAGKRVALANKEALVAGGETVIKRAEEKGVEIIPVDSEHSAVFQCLGYDRNADFERIILTASGGAFRNKTKAEIEKLTASDALKHPNWQMGKKITVDCATMLNKGLEVIEACRLYNCGLEKVKAVIHPESIVHSLVEFKDGAVLAQLGTPSMEIPIQLALTYPKRLETNVKKLDLIGKSLTFGEIDGERFPCFNLALEAFKKGGVCPCVMNSANETAVELYLQDKIGFYDISDLISYAIEKTPNVSATKENILQADGFARQLIKDKRGVKN